MKKIMLIILLLITPVFIKAETIYNSILRDNKVKQLPTEYNIFNCITRNVNTASETTFDPEADGTCIVGTDENAEYIKKYTDELEGLYPYTDDKGDIYFFRGWADNWIQLGSYENDTYYYFVDSINNFKTGTLEQCLSESSDAETYCKDIYKIGSKGDLMYWRIYRTNGDKSVRLVYAGTKIDDYTDKTNIGASAYNTKQDETKYAGYTYKENGQEVNSALKTYIENWYNNNNNTFKKYVVKSTFVNDTSTMYQNCYGNQDTDLCWPGYTRLYWWSEVNSYKINPNLQKSNSTAGYGGDYTLDVGTVTGDEMVLVGGQMWGYFTYNSIDAKWIFSSDLDKYDSRISYPEVWSITPGDSYISRATASDEPFGQNSRRQVEIIATNTCMFTEDATRYYGVKPVISIDGATEVVGKGTETDPYRIAFTKSIELRVNSESGNLNAYFNELNETDEVEWTIENPEILEIKDNKVIAKKIGSTKVTATVLGISYTINVKVTELSIIENPLTTTSITVVTYIIMFASGLYILFVATKLKKI